MAGTKNGNGIARNLLVGIAILIAVGIAASMYLGVRARNTAAVSAVEQATTIADRSLGLVFRPEDLAAPVSQTRASDLTGRITSVVLDPSNFESVTLWSQDGQILYSTEGGIGNTLEGERDRIKAALRGKAQTQSADGNFSIMVPLALRSGVGDPSVVEMSTSSAPIDAAPAPWRTNALFLMVLLAIVGFALYRTSRNGAATTSGRVATPQPAPIQTSQTGRPINVASPGLREEGDARRKAEDRARAAEERLSLLQDQYRKTLEDLRTAERRAQEAAANRPDPRLQEQLADTEQRARDYELKARELEGKLRTLEEEHRELARLAPDPDVMAKVNDRLESMKTERDALRGERDALLAERDELSAQRSDLSAQLAAGMTPTEDPELTRRVQQAETEVIGLRAELDGAETQLSMARRELETLRPQSEHAKEIQEDLDAAHVESLHHREAFESARSELDAAKIELEDARVELRALRNEEQRAAMLEDELRAARAELDSASASHRAELVEREAELEEKVRMAREEFQSQIAATEDAHADALATHDAAARERVAAIEAAARADVDALRAELADRDARYGSAEQAVAEASTISERLSQELTATKQELDTAMAELQRETEAVRLLTERAERAEREAAEASTRSSRLTADLGAATQDNADINRRLQELEARRALEIADTEGRADLDELLRVTQERLAGQTEKLIAAEDRAHKLERELKTKLEQVEQAEGELRRVQMSEAMRQIRGDGAEGTEEGIVVPIAEGEPLEDRRSTSPFMKELSHDARRSLSQILGLTQILKHKKDAKEQAQLVRQLTTYARRLDHVVTDMSEADNLVHGAIQLNVRRTDLEALVTRVVEESGVDADHDVRIQAERVVVAVDPLRTEQILAGLLRSSADRTPPKKQITVRLANQTGGAMLSVEDPEPSSDASLSPVVQRFAEVQGGWSKVESLEGGGSAFRVFLPDGAEPAADAVAPDAEPAADDQDLKLSAPDGGELHIVVDGDEETPDAWGQTPEQMLVQELHRLSEITAED